MPAKGGCGAKGGGKGKNKSKKWHVNEIMDSFPATGQHLLPAHSFDDVEDEEEGDDGTSEDEREILRRLGQSQARMEQV